MADLAQATPLAPVRERSAAALAIFVIASLGVHLALFLYLSTLEPRVIAPGPKPAEVVVVEVEKPKPPPPPEEKKPDPPPPPKKAPPIKVATVPKAPPPPKDPPPPPPPNETPPPQQPSKPVPLVVGISMSSTTTAGNFAAPVGNTLYGKTDNKAADPSNVKAYSAPKYMPIYQVDSEPSVMSEVKVPYPEEARKAGIEGTVTLSITIDNTGQVVSAKVVSGPGYGLNEAAREAIRKFKFKPAMKNGEAVSTEMKYSYTFLLD